MGERSVQVSCHTKLSVPTPVRASLSSGKNIPKRRNAAVRTASGDAGCQTGQGTLQSFFGHTKKRSAPDEGRQADVEDKKRRVTMAIKSLKETLGIDFEVPEVASIEELERLADQFGGNCGRDKDHPALGLSTSGEAS